MVTALILFLLSNVFPIVEMELKGIRMQTTLWGAVEALYADHRVLVALLVFATTILFPLAEMLMMLYLLVLMARQRYRPQIRRRWTQGQYAGARHRAARRRGVPGP
ncbi:Paraquat-inducible protein A [Collimonas sp. OK607]|nr:Paraquat-inducible protein A [Collimonas sp. OK607]